MVQQTISPDICGFHLLFYSINQSYSAKSEYWEVLCGKPDFKFLNFSNFQKKLQNQFFLMIHWEMYFMYVLPVPSAQGIYKQQQQF